MSFVLPGIVQSAAEQSFLQLVKEVGSATGFHHAAHSLVNNPGAAKDLFFSLQNAKSAKEKVIARKEFRKKGVPPGSADAVNERVPTDGGDHDESPTSSFLQKATELVRLTAESTLTPQDCGMNKFPTYKRPCSLGGKVKKEVLELAPISDKKKAFAARFIVSFGSECAGDLAAALGGRLPTFAELEQVVNTDLDADSDEKEVKERAGYIKKLGNLNGRSGGVWKQD